MKDGLSEQATEHLRQQIRDEARWNERMRSETELLFAAVIPLLRLREASAYAEPEDRAELDDIIHRIHNIGCGVDGWGKAGQAVARARIEDLFPLERLAMAKAAGCCRLIMVYGEVIQGRVHLPEQGVGLDE